MYRPFVNVYGIWDLYIRYYEKLKVVRQKNMVISRAGLGTKNDCADEDHRKFT
jgi:hypothetical protein